ncbi:IS4 family transposase [Thorsellia anophelis]|nr:IS4 family transposase [Thorsellia anophelis]
MQNAISIYMIVAWRVMRLMRLGRRCPDLPADLFFDADEITCTWLMSKQKPPVEVTRLNEMMRKVAMLGGFLGRKRDSELGPESLGIGLSRGRNSVFTLESIRQFGI